MQVTSIRLEAELKERLKKLSGQKGYQALIRGVLWDYVHEETPYQPLLSRADIRASAIVRAQREKRCLLTGKLILPSELM